MQKHPEATNKAQDRGKNSLKKLSPHPIQREGVTRGYRGRNPSFLALFIL